MCVNGFKAAAATAHLRYEGRFDMGLIVADSLSPWAGVFTQSACRAAPVLWSQGVVGLGYGRAFLVNAGQANAQTGAKGAADCSLAAKTLAETLAISSDEIMLASTGIIGQPINMEPFLAFLPKLVLTLKPQGLNDFSQAILTTDTRPKTAKKEMIIDEKIVTIWGCAKGSGMIAPNMATMLSFILTDASLSPELLQALLSEGAENTFNRITIDGDTSTNDSVMMMASGASQVEIAPNQQNFKIFRDGLFDLMSNLATEIVRDGEGATHLVKIEVQGAASLAEAKMAARTVAESPLVKTAFFGGDANWGRICMALGRCGATFDPYKVDIDLDSVPWIRSGVDNGQEEAASHVMKKPQYTLAINLKAGDFAYDMLTCDFSHDYVSINGSYRS
ncbi:MAG: bifunctional glutamate N-acetyltransferase/amino-acid acetyltransferase ArgJ [Candidatus Adiutrix sp.]